MRVGILGGSFDPPHVGHLMVAQEVRDALRLDQLLVIPAASQPLKQGQRTAATQRLEMTQRCFAGVPNMVVDPIEVDRGGLSYMVETVAALRQRWPSAELMLVVGQDVVTTLMQWRDPARLFSMVQLVVLRRAVAAENDLDGSADAGASRSASDKALPVGSLQLATRRVDVSSTEVRARVRDGRSIAGFVTDAVADYIASAGLYLQDPAAEGIFERA